MPLSDLSSIIVLVQPTGIFAREVFRFPENAPFRQFGMAEDALTVEGRQALNKMNSNPRKKINASTPIHLALSFNSSPKDVSKGFVFGSDPETCDILLGMDHYTGISGHHFSIGVDWATGNPLITCLTPNEGGTGIRIKSGSLWKLYLCNEWKVLDPGSTATIKIFEDMQFVVYSPDRSRDPIYRDNLQRYFEDCQDAAPKMTNLKLYESEPTPLLVTRGRGLTGMEYFTTSTIVGEKMVLSEAKSHQTLLGDLETFVVKRFRTVSDEWPNHAKTELSKLCNLRHRHIIAPEDIIAVMTEYMPVYLSEPPETLADIHAKIPLTEIDAAEVLAQTFEGLKFLHANGIVHGSIHPGSIRISGSNPWSIRLSDIGLHSYVELDDSQRRGYYASHTPPGSSGPTPKHDTWSAGVVGLSLILPGGLPPRPKRFPYNQSAWAAFMAARAKSFHESRPNGRLDASLFLTRVLKHDFHERLTAEECLQDRWIRLWHLPILDFPDPSDPFSYIPGFDRPLETINEVEND